MWILLNHVKILENIKHLNLNFLHLIPEPVSKKLFGLIKAAKSIAEKTHCGSQGNIERS